MKWLMGAETRQIITVPIGFNKVNLKWQNLVYSEYAGEEMQAQAWESIESLPELLELAKLSIFQVRAPSTKTCYFIVWNLL